MNKIIEILKNWVEVNLNIKDSNKKPHISYVVSTIISHPTSRALIKDMNGYDILKICYTIFFMFSGDDIEVAKQKADNLKMVTVTEVSAIEDEMLSCNNCDGQGDEECDNCDGQGELTCNYCYGNSECDECYSSGVITCIECGGEGHLECNECGGTGEVMSYTQFAQLTDTYWIYYDSHLHQKYIEMSNDKDNLSDFYDEANEHNGDIYLLKNNYRDMSLNELVEEYGKMDRYDERVTEVYDEIPLKFKEEMSVIKLGNSFYLK